MATSASSGSSPAAAIDSFVKPPILWALASPICQFREISTCKPPISVRTPTQGNTITYFSSTRPRTVTAHSASSRRAVLGPGRISPAPATTPNSTFSSIFVPSAAGPAAPKFITETAAPIPMNTAASQNAGWSFSPSRPARPSRVRGAMISKVARQDGGAGMGAGAADSAAGLSTA